MRRVMKSQNQKELSRQFIVDFPLILEIVANKM